jgi:hypothetical protein
MFGRQSMQELMHRRQMREDTNGARALGWASFAIGLTELLAPRQVENLLGIENRPDQQGVLRILGLRELCHGFGILTENAPTSQMTAGVCSRVAGDVLDTVLLGAAALKTKKPGMFAAVAASVLAIGLADMYHAQRLARHQTDYA